MRTLDAPDWAQNGHTNTTVWMGTDNDPGAWVEVGVTDGFHGANVYKFYSAHQYWDAAIQMYVYDDVTIGKTPVLGRDTTFTVRQTATSFRGEAGDIDGTSGVGWSHHALPVADYDIGVEYTCRENARADKHFVMMNQYRRDSDGSWVSPTLGTLLPSGNAGTNIVWCTQPRTSRFWVHSVTPTGSCS